MVALTLGFVGKTKEPNNHFLARVYLPTHYSTPSHVNSLEPIFMKFGILK